MSRDFFDTFFINPFPICQNGLQKTQRRIGGNHKESQDWRKAEVNCLLESTITIVSERSQCTKCLYLEYHSVCPSLELGPPTPFPGSECAYPLNQRRGEHTRLRVREWGSPNADDWRESLVLCVPVGPTRLFKQEKTTCPLLL